MTTILQILLGLALLNYAMADVVSPALKPAQTAARLHTMLTVAACTSAAFLAAAIMSFVVELFILDGNPNPVASTLVFMVALAASLHGIAALLGKRQRLFMPATGSFPVLVLANSVVLALTMPTRANDIGLTDVLIPTFARCAGFTVIVLCFTAFRERLRGADVPAALQGAPATLLAAAMLSMIFMGLA